MLKTLLCALLLLGGTAFAATPVTSVNACVQGINSFKTVPIGPTISAEVSQSATGAVISCQTLSTVPATWFVRISTTGGNSWSFVTLASQGVGIGSGAPTPPIPVPASATLTWSAPTTNSDGSTLTLPVTYNLYKGTTCAGVAKIAPVTSPYIDTGVAVGSTYFWAVTALDTSGESALSACVSLTIAAPPAPNIVPATPANVTVK